MDSGGLRSDLPPKGVDDLSSFAAVAAADYRLDAFSRDAWSGRVGPGLDARTKP
jgi:hypothetical protein